MWDLRWTTWQCVRSSSPFTSVFLLANLSSVTDLASITYYMKISRNITNLQQVLMMDRQVFDGVRNFIYLGKLINSKKLINI